MKRYILILSIAFYLTNCGETGIETKIKPIDLVILADEPLGNMTDSKLSEELINLLEPIKVGSDSFLYVPTLKIKRVDLDPNQEQSIATPESNNTRKNRKSGMLGPDDLITDHVNEAKNIKVEGVLTLPKGNNNIALHKKEYDSLLIYNTKIADSRIGFSTIDELRKSIENKLNKNHKISELTIAYNLSVSNKKPDIKSKKKSETSKTATKAKSETKITQSDNYNPSNQVVTEKKKENLGTQQKATAQITQKPKIDFHNLIKGEDVKKIIILDTLIKKPTKNNQ